MERTQRLIEELRGLLEEAKKPLVVKNYLKKCDKAAIGKNIRHFVHVSKMPQKQAVAAALATYRRACSRGEGTPADRRLSADTKDQTLFPGGGPMKIALPAAHAF